MRPKNSESCVGLQRWGDGGGGPGALTQIRQSVISSGKLCEEDRTE